MSQMETSERLDRAQDHVWVAERALHADPTNKWPKMLADLLRAEDEPSPQILAKDPKRGKVAAAEKPMLIRSEHLRFFAYALEMEDPNSGETTIEIMGQCLR